MIYRLIFNRAGSEKKKSILQNKAVHIGCFNKEKRNVYVYLLDNFFVEAFYQNDDPENALEKASSFTDYKKLEKYMEESVNQSK